MRSLPAVWYAFPAVPLLVFFLARCSSSSEDTGAGGAASAGSTTTMAGPAGPGTGPGTGTSSGAGGGMSTGANVVMHHKNVTRDGVTIDPAFTKQAASGLHLDAAFSASVMGAIYAQPLFVDGGSGGKDMLFVATEADMVYALDPATGATIWSKSLGTPVSLGSGATQCGNIDPLGITGTPVIDLASRTLFVDAMTTPDGGQTGKHMVFALSIDDGSVKSGWPIDANASFTAGSGGFDSSIQGERGALALIGGVLYVPYGGYWGDCGSYHGWVVGIPIANPTQIQAIATRAVGGGIWGMGGVASDGQHLFVTTGNTFGATEWQDGEAILRLSAGPTFSAQAADYFAPTDWKQLDDGDVDIGGSSPVLLDVPGATPSALVVALGKNGKAYLIDRTNLGGVGEGVANATVANNEIINAPAAYRTSQGAYVVFKGSGASCPNGSGDLTSLRITAASPPAITTAWCASQNGTGSPMVTMSADGQDAIVWSLGSEGDHMLHGFDADTGAVVFDGGGTSNVVNGTRRFATPIAAKGRIYVGGTDNVFAFTL